MKCHCYKEWHLIHFDLKIFTVSMIDTTKVIKENPDFVDPEKYVV